MADIIFFNAGSREICKCPCHQGIRRWFHCWEDCCKTPDVVWSAESLKDAIREALVKDSNG